MAKIPTFSLPGSDGATHGTKSLKGTAFVLYFYPKDATPGCTTEACDFRDHHRELAKIGVQVFGISPDTLASHAKFIAKQQLNFVLLADEGHVVADKLGVWIEKKLYGRSYMGVERATFLVGADGTILQEWHKVKVAGHAADVVDAAKAALAD